MANQNRYKTEITLLINTGGHRTADQIYEKLKKSYYFLGIGSVYRNLTELVQEGVVMKTSGILDKIIYEKAKPLHGHIVCHKSLAVFDVDISHLMVENNLVPENFNLDSINIVFDGYFTGNSGIKCDGVAQVMNKTGPVSVNEEEKKLWTALVTTSPETR